MNKSYTNLNTHIYKAAIIYAYLMVLIAVLLYKYPALIDYHKQHEEAEKQQSYSEYISGGYLQDEKLFPVDEMYFPLALCEQLDECIYYYDTYGGERTYGGNRSHEGCDIMCNNNMRGEFPVVSICDGVIEKTGWLELGGYRIGIRSETGIYYYYAHLYRYEECITEGMTVYAGQVIGYIGDTGYSKVEGTTGNFDVHLHFGIYLTDKAGNEYTVNPYPMLKKLENNVINYSFKN